MESVRKRARELGIAPGILPTGPLNAITDVHPVEVGHVTVIEGDDIRTGATAILPHRENVYQRKVPAGIAVGNGYGKLTGSTQIRELGEIETPIVLTNTLCVPRAAEAILDWVLALPGNEAVTTVNPVVGETNDGRLNNIRYRVLTPDMFRRAIDEATGGPVDEGSVGAGTGTMAFGWKGGIGTSSRVIPNLLGGYSVGVLVQSNFGGVLQILGVPVGRALGRYYLKDVLSRGDADGSIMIILATDAPLSDRNLSRLARRALFGLARTGASFVNGSGDYAIAFSVADDVRRTPERRQALSAIANLPNELISPLFQAAIEATEEAILNSLFTAATINGNNGFVGEAIPLDRVLDMLGGGAGKTA
ncbi:P1 family peptidase [uncultured Desulfosarcina sp.]|uniref:DmpA family aminopeptidase n=1 Tax=uncultured Desulfosarcina sp. TaxID=218289 RepID=UPI0029C9715C|nr:P1 family peptidase [uncultured Desulfosarcina sp.]